MLGSAAILVVSVVIVGMLFVFGIQQAVKIRSTDRKWSWWAALLFIVVTAHYWIVGHKGWVQDFSQFPPPFAAFFISLLALSVFVAFSGFGTLLVQLSLRSLIMFQGFRILAELVIYQAVKEGLAPIQMSWEGQNFDILIGFSALIVGFFFNSKKAVVYFWNLAGLLSLVNIARIAILSMPTPLRTFMNEPSNIWVTTAPYILLPGILVVAAWSGHLIVWRKLNSQS